MNRKKTMFWGGGGGARSWSSMVAWPITILFAIIAITTGREHHQHEPLGGHGVDGESDDDGDSGGSDSCRDVDDDGDYDDGVDPGDGGRRP